MFFRRMSTMRPSPPSMIASAVGNGFLCSGIGPRAGSGLPDEAGAGRSGRLWPARESLLERVDEEPSRKGIVRAVLAEEGAGHRDGDAGGLEPALGAEHVRHLEEALRVPRAALGGEVRGGGVL